MKTEFARRQVAAGFEEEQEKQQPRPASSAQSTEPRARSTPGIYVAPAPDMQSCIEQWELVQTRFGSGAVLLPTAKVHGDPAWEAIAGLTHACFSTFRNEACSSFLCRVCMRAHEHCPYKHNACVKLNMGPVHVLRTARTFCE